MNRVFENHVVTMRESDNGMSTWRPNRMMSSKATKTDWQSALYQESFDLTPEKEHSWKGGWVALGINKQPSFSPALLN
jgi:hypothetical protein